MRNTHYVHIVHIVQLYPSHTHAIPSTSMYILMHILLFMKCNYSNYMLEYGTIGNKKSLPYLNGRLWIEWMKYN